MKNLALSVFACAVVAGGSVAFGQLRAGEAETGGKIPASRDAKTVGPMATAQGTVWQNPDSEWLASWFKERNAVVEGNRGLEFDPTGILVRFKAGVSEEQVGAALAAIGGRTVETWGLVPGLYHVAVPWRTESVEEALKQLNDFNQRAGTIEFAELDTLGHITAAPNDPYFGYEWGMDNLGQSINGDPGTVNADIDAPQAWGIAVGSSSVAVGMCDTGIRRTHEDLAANIWTNPRESAGNHRDDDHNGYADDTWGWDFWNNDRDPTDDHGHGTHTAGTVGAVGNNGRGVSGVCWTVRMAALKIGSASGSVSQSAAISAINYCVGKGIKVSNHSWSGGGYSQSMASAVSSARAAGHMLVCAAGNGGSDGVGDNNDMYPSYPASYGYDNIISVAAIDNDNALAGFSNYGASSVDIAAPGVGILSTFISGASDNTYVFMNGTSMATPHVTGACALVWSAYPSLNYAQVRARILSGAKPLPSLTGRCVTGGCLNLYNAVR